MEASLNSLFSAIAAAVAAASFATAPHKPVDAPSWWLRTSGWACIHGKESSDWHYGPEQHHFVRRWNGYYNGFQFTIGTWEATNVMLHRHDDPQWSPPGVQRLHAFAEWSANGHRWGGHQWPTSSVECGLP